MIYEIQHIITVLSPTEVSILYEIPTLCLLETNKNMRAYLMGLTFVLTEAR